MKYTSAEFEPRYRVIDIETTGIDEASEFIESANAPANYKDEAKIAAYIAEANVKALGMCALDPDLARVVAIGIADPAVDGVHVLTAKNVAEERELLIETWRQLAGQVTVVGYNVLAYDLPVLLRRSLYLRVPVRAIQIDKYRHPSVIDLMQVLSFNGAIKFRGLKFYAKRFGLPVDDTVKGSEIPALVEAGRWEDVLAHVTSDVQLTLALARRLGVVNPAMEPAAVL